VTFTGLNRLQMKPWEFPTAASIQALLWWRWTDPLNTIVSCYIVVKQTLKRVRSFQCAVNHFTDSIPVSQQRSRPTLLLFYTYISILVWSKLLAAAIRNVRYAIRMSRESVLIGLQVKPCTGKVLKYHRFYLLSIPNIFWKSQLHIYQPLLYHAQGRVPRLKMTFWSKCLALEISESNLKAIRYSLLFAVFQQRL